MSRDRKRALRWSYFFLILFALFFLMPPIYMLITSLKSSGEIAAARNPWWVFEPTLINYQALLGRSEEHTSELQSLMRISYAVFCLKKQTQMIIRGQNQLTARTSTPTLTLNNV